MSKCALCGKNVVVAELATGQPILLSVYPSREGTRYRLYGRRDMKAQAIKTRNMTGHRLHEETCASKR